MASRAVVGRIAPNPNRCGAPGGDPALVSFEARYMSWHIPRVRHGRLLLDYLTEPYQALRERIARRTHQPQFVLVVHATWSRCLLGLTHTGGRSRPRPPRPFPRRRPIGRRTDLVGPTDPSSPLAVYARQRSPGSSAWSRPLSHALPALPLEHPNRRGRRW